MKLRNIILSSMVFVFSITVDGTSKGTDDVDHKEPISIENEVSNKEKYINYDQFSSKIKVSGRLLKIKVYNNANELIAKWQGSGFKVKAAADKFLTKASSGEYRIQIFLYDGSYQGFVLEK